MHDHVLLVDDDQDDQFFFCDILSELMPSAKCHTSNNGLEAILYLNSASDLPTVIFLDLNMPFMNGFECLHEIKKDKRFQNIPVIIITTSSNPYDKEKTKEMGAIHFFTKPSDYLEYKKQLADLLSTVRVKH